MTDDIKQVRAELSVEKGLARRRAEKLSEDSEWTILEQIAQEIEASFMVKKEKTPSLEKVRELLALEVQERYRDDEEVRQILLEAIPSKVAMSKWRKKKGWEEAVWGKVRGTGLFTGEKRAIIISSLFDSARDGNINAAKIWLTLSGDYQEKGNNSNEVVDQFREINNILLNPKK